MPRKAVSHKGIVSRFLPGFMRRRHRQITFEGVLFVILTIIIGLAALNTGANLLYMILSVMLCLLIVSGFESTLTLTGLNLKRTAPEQAIAGESHLAHIEIKNRKPLFASYSLQFSDFDSQNERHGSGYIFHIGARKSVRASYYLTFPRRGLYALDHLRVISRFPFGFFQRALDFYIQHQVIVYPRVIDIRAFFDTASLESGEIEGGRKGIGTNLYGLREYTLQDSARWIHWKVTARARKLMVREFEKEEKKRVTLILNNHIESDRAEDSIVAEAFEQAIIIAASFAKFLMENEYNVQLVTASGKVPFSSGQNHLHRIMRALALLELTDEAPRISMNVPRPEADSSVLFLKYHNYPSGRPQNEHLTVINVMDQRVSTMLNIKSRAS